MRELTTIKFKNALNSGIDVTLVYHPILDGPLEMYENSDECEVKVIQIEDEQEV